MAEASPATLKKRRFATFVFSSITLLVLAGLAAGFWALREHSTKERLRIGRELREYCVNLAPRHVTWERLKERAEIVGWELARAEGSPPIGMSGDFWSIRVPGSGICWVGLDASGTLISSAYLPD